MPTKIFVPTDFSKHSDKALDRALDIAKQYGAKVFLLHVISEIRYPAVNEFYYSAKWRQLEDSLWNETEENFSINLINFSKLKSWR